MTRNVFHKDEKNIGITPIINDIKSHNFNHYQCIAWEGKTNIASQYSISTEIRHAEMNLLRKQIKSNKKVIYINVARVKKIRDEYFFPFSSMYKL